jgi:hypothetical protein
MKLTRIERVSVLIIGFLVEIFGLQVLQTDIVLGSIIIIFAGNFIGIYIGCESTEK